MDAGDPTVGCAAQRVEVPCPAYVKTDTILQRKENGRIKLPGFRIGEAVSSIGEVISTDAGPNVTDPIFANERIERHGIPCSFDVSLPDKAGLSDEVIPDFKVGKTIIHPTVAPFLLYTPGDFFTLVAQGIRPAFCEHHLQLMLTATEGDIAVEPEYPIEVAACKSRNYSAYIIVPSRIWLFECS